MRARSSITVAIIVFQRVSRSRKAATMPICRSRSLRAAGLSEVATQILHLGAEARPIAGLERLEGVLVVIFSRLEAGRFRSEVGAVLGSLNRALHDGGRRRAPSGEQRGERIFERLTHHDSIAVRRDHALEF